MHYSGESSMKKKRENIEIFPSKRNTLKQLAAFRDSILQKADLEEQVGCCGFFFLFCFQSVALHFQDPKFTLNPKQNY